MIKNLLTKKPFVRVAPNYSLLSYESGDINSTFYDDRVSGYVVLKQSDFIRELNISGHKINSPIYYPNKIKYDEENNRYFEQQVIRTAFPFQKIILTQQLIHLCGNDIHIESTSTKISEEDKNATIELKKGWMDKNMEIAFYELAKSVKSTGDGAIVIYMSNGKVKYKPLSFLYGDRLFPHYDQDGEIDTFVRLYVDYDEDGNELTEWVEVWDDKYMTRYKKDKKGLGGVISSIKEYLGLDGFVVDMPPVMHGFNEVPIIYKRDDNGPCWSDSQDAIDKYELAVSHLCQNNMAYAFPIMVLKGDDVTIKGDIYGDVKCITMGNEDDAKYLSPSDASQSFTVQLNTLLKMIFMGGFIVEPPEVKSGDLPGVAIKLIYSPSLEKAIVDSKEYDAAVDKLVRLFKFGYGIEIGKVTQMSNLSVFSWIDPYVHQNMSELVNNLCMLVNSGVLSKDTASSLSGYGENNEFDKIMKEWKETQAADLLNDIKNTDGVQTTGETTA